MTHQYPLNHNSHSPQPESTFKNSQLNVSDLDLSNINYEHLPIHTVKLNITQKFQFLVEKAKVLQSDLYNCHLDGNEDLKYIGNLKQKLLYKKLADLKEEIVGQIGGLHRLVQVTKLNHESRSNDLRQKNITLWNKTEQMRQSVFELRMRLQKMEEMMGFGNNQF